MKRTALLLPLVPSLLLSVSAAAASSDHHWPQWRGPAADGVAPHGEPPVTWSEEENVLWKVEVPGRGSASPVVWGDTLFLLTAAPTGKPAAAGEGDGDGPAFGRGVTPDEVLRFVVLAYDRHTGAIRWQKTAVEAAPHEGTHTDGTWASASAVTDGEVLVASFGSRGLYAYDLAGNLRWSKDLGDMHTRHAFGEGSSPALSGDVVVVNWDHEGDSFIVASTRIRAGSCGAGRARRSPPGRRRWWSSTAASRRWSSTPPSGSAATIWPPASSSGRPAA